MSSDEQKIEQFKDARSAMQRTEQVLRASGVEQGVMQATAIDFILRVFNHGTPEGMVDVCKDHEAVMDMLRITHQRAVHGMRPTSGGPL